MTGLLDRQEVPAFHVAFTTPPRSRVCVLIPVINEGERLLGQLQNMRRLALPQDMVIVDGGSSDGSTDATVLQPLGVGTLLVKTGPGKLSAQLRVGMAWALEQGYEGIITIDGNGKDDPGAIPAFEVALSQGYDFIQGSRYVPGGIAERTPWDRELGVRLIHAPLLSLAARFRYTDTTNGFRGFSRRFLQDPQVRPLRAVFSTYNLHYYLSIQAPRLGFRVRELPVTRRYPASGPTPSKIGGLAGKLHILKQTVLAAAGAYRPR